MFPDQWKISRISPLPKVENPKAPKDIRLISVLPILSKVFEKIILYRMNEQIDTLLRPTQSGVRKGHSTIMLLLKMKDDINRAMRNGEVTIAFLADYSKAFLTSFTIKLC